MTKGNALTVEERKFLKQVANNETIDPTQYKKETMLKCLELLQSHNTYCWVDNSSIGTENEYFLEMVNQELEK